MQKIGLFGGTFNPIHEGHLRLAAAFYKELGLDKLYFIPDHTPPHKDASLLASGLDRYNMCRVATVDMQGTEVCDYEIRRDTKSYTVHTVRYFKDAYPDAELYLLMGGDMFLTVQHWVEAQTIFALAAVCGGARNVGEYQALVDHAQILTQNGARPLVVDIEPYIASSTVIRAGMGTGADFAHDALPVSVGRYIDTVRPYGGEQEEIVRYRQALSERLSAKRHEHSVCVAKEAVVLAILFGADEKKAYTAGLLHDIAKDLTHDEQLQMLKKFGIILDDTERGAPKLWHAIIGAHYIGTLGINDAEIINAIRY
ncbi:MAG: nicotinate (nicotinamide) nucleotide adenylyltransferase, partial [Acetanaerobacterium sp.]